MRVTPTASNISRAVRLAALVALLAVGLAFLTGLGGRLGWALAIVAGGAIAAVVAVESVDAIVSSAVAGALGSVLAVYAWGLPRAAAALPGWPVAHAADRAVRDELLPALMRASAVNADWGPYHLGLIAALTIGTSAAAAGLHRFVATPLAEKRRRAHAVLGTVATAVVATALIAGAWGSAARGATPQPMAPGTYSDDAAIYMNAYFNLLRGTPYYESLVSAAGNDMRLMRAGAVKDGKLSGWVSSASAIPQPLSFYVWGIFAPGGGLWYASLVASVLALFVVWWGMYGVLSARAALIPPVLFPLLMVCAGSENVFFPEWWAALALLYSVMLQIRARYVLAGVFALIAAVFAQVALAWLAILFVHAAFRGWRDGREWRRRTLLYAALLAGFAALYLLHLKVGSAYVTADARALDSTTRAPGSPSAWPAAFLAPARYMMAPYAAFAGQSAWPLFAQVPGWWLALRREPMALWPVLGLLVFWLVLAAAGGAGDARLGQMCAPLALVGSAALVARFCPNPDAA